MRSWLRNPFARCAVALLAVLLATIGLHTGGADLAVAAIVLMLAVVGASVLGFFIGLAAALEAFLLLSYLFARPRESLAIDQTDDLVALAAFVAVSIVVGAIVARLNDLRARASLAAREANLRLRVANELLAGLPAQDVAPAVCTELNNLFDLRRCELEVGDGPTRLIVEPNRPLQPYERATLDAFEVGVCAAFDRARLDELAREHRVNAEIDRARAGFLAALTHDLRTPLSTIKAANAALLASEGSLDPDDRRDLIDASYREASRLEQLVTSALEITRIRSGGLRPEPVAIAIADLVRGATQRLFPRSSDRGITLTMSPELPAAYVDATMLERAIANVLENALRYSPPEQAIEVTASCSGSILELYVCDHGPGVPACDRERIFGEFEQAGSSTPSVGVGLGLAITRAFAEANGGVARCEETPGGGATFVLTMPVALHEK